MKEGEFMGIVFLLLDEQDSIIQGFISASRATHYRHTLREGAIFTIESFEVVRSVTTFKLTSTHSSLRLPSVKPALSSPPLVVRNPFSVPMNNSIHWQTPTPNYQAHDAEFLCKSRIVEVTHNNGWSYVACSRCNTKLEKNGTSLRCSKCITAHATGLLRYRVELGVYDEHDSATFIVFDS